MTSHQFSLSGHRMNETYHIQQEIIYLMRRIGCTQVSRSESEQPAVHNYCFMFEDETEED